MVEFGHQLDDGLIATPDALVFVLPDGDFGSVDIANPGAFRFYDSRGQFRIRLDRRGDGPGEYRGVSDLFKVAEGYLIFDMTLGRLSWVDPDFRFLRSEPVGRAPLRMALLPDEEGVVVNGLTGDLSRGDVLEILRFDGASSRAFGGDGGPVDLRSNRLAHHRVMAVDSDGGIWASHLTRYQLVRYSQTGDTLAVLERVGDIFPPSERSVYPRDDRDPPPTPRMRELIVDGDGLLWSVFRVADPEWKEAIPNPDPLRAPDDNGVWDTVVEVLDPKSGLLLARARVPWSLADVEMTESLGQVLLWYITEKPSGTLGATVLRFSLEGGDG